MIRTGGTGKPAKPPMGMYVRADTRRFVPHDTVKELVRHDWVDTDSVARIELEHRIWEPLRATLVDEHGYPTA